MGRAVNSFTTWVGHAEETLSDEKGNAGVHNLIQMAASSVDYQFA